MFFKDTFFQQARAYKNNEDGDFALIWGLCFLVMMFFIGTVMDISRQMSASHKAQNIADSIALAAAVYVSTYGEPPADATLGFPDNHEYTAAELGYDFPGSDDMSFKVVYDDANKEARVITTGNVDTMFMQIFNHNTLDFASTSTAKFAELEDLHPASIVFVLDNSGSMWFDDIPYEIWPESGVPDDAVRRIDSLKYSLNHFNTILSGLGLDETVEGDRFLRTGMIPYNEDIIQSGVVPMQWDVLDQHSDINAMTPGGATNSSPPISEAWDWMQDEPTFHFQESGETNPHKFVIFMTDGQNTIGTDIWIPEEDTLMWRKKEYEAVCGYNRRGRYRCYWKPYWDYFNEAVDGVHDDHTHEPDGSGWEEGRIYLSTDLETMAACEEMKAAGVNVYTIGFALEAGIFGTNDWATSSSTQTWEVTPETKSKSTAVLSACASKPQNFILAEDAEALTGAFEMIGNDIIKEVIRIKS